MFLLWIILENALGGGVLARFICPGRGSLNSFCLGWELAHQKKFPGAMVRLGID